MQKYKKYLAIGIITLFIGASVLPSVLGNNYTSMDNISEEVIQTNFYNIDDKSLILWAGWGNVTWNFGIGFEVEVGNTDSSEFTYNLSEPGTVWIIIIYNVTNKLLQGFRNKHGGRFTCEVVINGDLKDQIVIDRGNTDPGTYPYYNGIIIPVEILTNTTLDIHMEIGAAALQVIPLLFGIMELDIVRDGDHAPRTDIVHFQLP